MKLLKLSFALILIGLALLLSAASEKTKPAPEINPQSATAPKNKKPPITNPTNERKEKEQSRGETPLLSPQPSPEENTRQRDYEKRQIEIQERIADYTFALVWVGGIIGFFQVVVMLGTYFVTNKAANAARESAHAAIRAAEASEKSATTARLALQSDRPYLLIERVALVGFARPSMLNLVAGIIIARNYGKGPALIDESVGAIKIVDATLPSRDYSGCIELGAPEIISPGRSARQNVMLTTKVISETDRELILNDRKYLIIYGRIKYRDLVGNNYTEGFYWQADALAARIAERMVSKPIEPQMKRGPKTHNYHE